KLRLVIFDFLSSGIRIPLLLGRRGGTQPPSPPVCGTVSRRISTCVTPLVTRGRLPPVGGGCDVENVGAGIRTPDLRIPQERRGQETARTLRVRRSTRLSHPDGSAQ